MYYAYGLISALGEGVDASAEALLAWRAKGSTPLTRHNQALLDGRLTWWGGWRAELPAIPAALAPYASRNNQLLLAARLDISTPSASAGDVWPTARVGLVLGTSTAGIGEAELAGGGCPSAGAVPSSQKCLRHTSRDEIAFNRSRYFLPTAAFLTYVGS